MKQRIVYKKRSFVLDVDFLIRKGQCACCGRKGLTSLHHWKYEFPLKEVRKDKIKALKNTTELCFKCHELANALRKINEAKPEIINKLKELQKQALN